MDGTDLTCATRCWEDLEHNAITCTASNRGLGRWEERARQVGGEGIGLGGWEERARQVGGEGIGLGGWEERALD